MTYDEFLRQVAKAGLKANEFARLMDMSPKSLSNYKKTGRIPHHLAVVAVLLAEMKERSIDFRALLANVDRASSTSTEPVKPLSGQADDERE